MIAFIRGVINNFGYDSVVIDVSGIGYSAHMHIRDVSALKKGQNVEVYISEVIREQSYDLYGFIESEDKHFFDTLLKVSGVGPRIALALLGIANRSEIAGAINNNDVALISSAPGIGKRLAERIILELKGKINSDENYINTQAIGAGRAEEALMALGFNSNDSKAMLKGIDASLSVEEQIRQALRAR